MNLIFLIINSNLYKYINHKLYQLTKSPPTIFFIKLTDFESKSTLVNKNTIKQSSNAFKKGVRSWLVIKPIKYDFIHSLLYWISILASIIIMAYIMNPLNDNPTIIATQFLIVSSYLSSSNSSEIGWQK